MSLCDFRIWGSGYLQRNRPLAAIQSGVRRNPMNEEKIMKRLMLGFAIAFAVVSLARSQTSGSDATKSPLDGTWELVSGQTLPEGVRDIKIISAGHFIFVAYETESGKALYTGGGTYTLNGGDYNEHMDFGEKIASGLIGKDQRFAVKLEDDRFTQTGTLSNGKPLSEIWRRMR